MEPINFPEANKVLLKPESMTDEECTSLCVFTDGEMCISLWKMSWRERLSAILHGKVWVFVISGRTQPPIALSVEKTVFRQEVR